MDRPINNVTVPNLKVMKLPHATGIPFRATAGAACFDLEAAAEEYLSPTKARAIVPTGIAIQLPPGYVGLVCSRSGLAAKNGVFVLNAPGVIDEDYRGEIKVILGYNPIDQLWPEMTSQFIIGRGMRIAQLLILKQPDFAIEEVISLDETIRAAGGLGSTGV